MSFQETADSLSAKAHIESKKKYIAAGLVLVVIGVLALLAWMYLKPASFSIDTANASNATQAESESSSTSSSENTSGTDTSQDSSTTNAQENAAMYIHVIGAVQAPGVYGLSANARVCDAIEAAGGLRSDASEQALNLARVLNDGEQIQVLTQEEYEESLEVGISLSSASSASSATSSSATGATTSTGLININKATVDELDTLPGVGPSTAQKIVADRESNGPFASIEELKRVSGIGDKKYEQLSGLICVG